MTYEELVSFVTPMAFTFLGIPEDEVTEELTLNMNTMVEDAICFVYERRGLGEIDMDDIDAYVTNRSRLIAQLASAVFNKEGVNGQTAHSENGIVRSYDSSGYPYDLVARIIPLARTYGTTED